MIKKKLKQNVNLSAIIDNTGNTQDIQQLKIDVAANTNNITTNTQNIASLQQDVANNTAEIGRFNQITTDLELKYNGLEPKVTQNTNDIAALQTKTDEIDPLKTRVDTLEPKVTKNETDIAALDTVVKRDEIRIGLLEIFQTDTENTLQVLENQGNQLEQRVNQHTTDIANINTTLTNVPKLNTVNTFTQNQFIKGTTLSKFALRNDANQDPLSLETTTSGNQGVIKNNAGGTIRYENGANPTNPGDCTNKQYVDGINTALTNRINTIETSLENGNIVNYAGVYSATTTYNIGQCVTYNNKWYVSKIDNNTGNTPSPNSQQWELLSAPTIDLTPYLTKTEAGQTYETIANVTALTARVTTNEQNIANKANQADLTTLSGRVDTNENAIDQIEQELQSYAKLGLDNTFTANNTFDNPVVVPTPTQNNHAANKAYVDANVLIKETIPFSNATLTTTTLAGGTINVYNYAFDWTNNKLANKNIDNIVSMYVVHPNGTFQPGRMYITGLSAQKYPQDTTRQGILVSLTPVGTDTEAYRNGLQLVVNFRS